MEHPTFEELFAACHHDAVHLEMRDEYTPDDPIYQDWRNGVTIDPAERFGNWLNLMKKTTGRGVRIRRARVVSEPITEYIRYEYDVTTGLNIAGGEQVRWLPRRRASAIALPGNDFWVFDNTLVRLNHFAGNGEYLDGEITEDPATVKLCNEAFEAVWAHGIDHLDYRPA